MRKQLLLTVASAALIAGMAPALAQTPPEKDRGAPTKMQEAPKAAPSNAQSTPKADAPAVKAEQKGDAGKAADTMKQDSGKAAQSDKAAPATRSQAQDSSKSGTTSAAPDANKSAAPSTAQDSGKSGASATGQTTGQGAAATQGAVQISTEQRTKIKSAINIASAPKVTNVNFSISVGTKVPRDRVRFQPLPASIVEIVPAYRGYLYFVVDDRIIIVQPDTYEIVLIIT